MSRLERKPIYLQPLHDGQKALNALEDRFIRTRCGRRWGKSAYCITKVCELVMQGRFVGVMTPTYRQSADLFIEIQAALMPLIVTASRIDNRIEIIGGGRVDFFSLAPGRAQLAGRGQKYHFLFLDESAWVECDMPDVWQNALRPTLVDFTGRCMAMSTPRGMDGWFAEIVAGESSDGLGFTDFHAPSWSNPYLPPAEIEELRKTLHPMSFSQEIEANLVNWQVGGLIDLEWMLDENKQPFEMPKTSQSIIACIDTAVKTGSSNDTTAVVICSYDPYAKAPMRQVMILDWFCVQVSGALLEEWIPMVFTRMKTLAQQCRAREGYGTFIEDTAAGSVLLQQLGYRGIGEKVLPVPSKLVSKGKDPRMQAAANHVYSRNVGFTREAFEKVENVKGSSRNHLISQLTGYKIGDPKAGTRADDLADAWSYCVLTTLGNPEGY